MPTSPANPASLPDISGSYRKSASKAPMRPQTDVDGFFNHPRYFSYRNPGEKPMCFLRLMVILLPCHIGARSRNRCEEGFLYANGLHVFIAANVYFVLVVGTLILLVNIITSL